MKQAAPTPGKKKRFVLFIGNLPYDVSKQDLAGHFKNCKVKHVRIPTEKGTNKPRGFAYLELENDESYEKALTLHHTQIKGRRINVLYSQGGKKQGDEKKKEVKAKNLKLHAMRRQGKFLGKIKLNQKRAERRKKKLAASTNQADD